MAAYLGLVFGAAGVVFGVIALMMTVESSRKMARMINARFQQSELELMKGLDAQDSELKRQRRTLGEALETLDERFKAQSASITEMQIWIEELRGVRRAIPSDEDRGFVKKGSEFSYNQS